VLEPELKSILRKYWCSA